MTEAVPATPADPAAVEFDWNSLTLRDIFLLEEKSGLKIEQLRELDADEMQNLPLAAVAAVIYIATNKQTPMTWDQFLDEPIMGRLSAVKFTAEVDPTNAAG